MRRSAARARSTSSDWNVSADQACSVLSSSSTALVAASASRRAKAVSKTAVRRLTSSVKVRPTARG